LGLALNCDPSDSYLWVARITGVSHQCLAALVILEIRVKAGHKLEQYVIKWKYVRRYWSQAAPVCKSELSCWCWGLAEG
jgi:hypothetical protein